MTTLEPDVIGSRNENTVGTLNRGLENRITSQDTPQIRITLEAINGILIEYITNVIKPTIEENNTSREVPVIYGTPERWAAIRKDGILRDAENTKLLTPLIVLRRSRVNRGKLMNPNNKYVYTSIDAGWNRRNAYDRFAVQNNIRPSRQIRTVIIPDYMDLTYDVLMWTEYQTQMDALIEQINVEAEEYWGERNNYKFRVMIDTFENQSELPATKDRVVRSRFEMKVGAYLLPERMVKNFRLAPPDTKAYTAKKIVAFTETVSDINSVKG